jgi:hypothetical protein
VSVDLVLIGVVDLRARDPIGDHLILHIAESIRARPGLTRIVAAAFAIVAREQFGRCQTGSD